VTFVHPGSPADIQGVTPGTIITEIDHEDVKTADDFNRIKSKLSSRTKAVAMIAYDIRGNVKYFAIKPR
jgi:S1-C subfamily serine protease